jgi:phage shock protein E
MSDDTPTDPAERAQPPRRWPLRAAVAAGAAAVVAYFALGMPGMDHSAATQPHDMSNMGAPTTSADASQLSPRAFAEAAKQPLGVVINVHVPYEGEIPGTDAIVPYDDIDNSGALPSDASDPILLYCMTGDMSRIAADTLASMGYTNVRTLAGGMDAWEASGRPIVTS